jgi:exosome complex component RRP4
MNNEDKNFKINDEERDFQENDENGNIEGEFDNNKQQDDESEGVEKPPESDEFEDEETSRELVVPGEILTEDIKNFLPGRGTIFNDKKDKIISLYIGLKQIKKNYVNVIPLKGLYTPQAGDKVLAIVVEKNPVKYKCDINAKDYANLKPKNTMKKFKLRLGRGKDYENEDISTDRFDIGDVLIVKVLSANRLNMPEITTVGKYLGKKMGGIVISIDPPKIPRVIGRNGSMIKMLKNLTKCNIFVTQNGRIWIKGDNITYERLLIDAIYKIEQEAHTKGLTDRVQAYIENEKVKRGIK